MDIEKVLQEAEDIAAQRWECLDRVEQKALENILGIIAFPSSAPPTPPVDAPASHPNCKCELSEPTSDQSQETPIIELVAWYIFGVLVAILLWKLLS